MKLNKMVLAIKKEGQSFIFGKIPVKWTVLMRSIDKFKTVIRPTIHTVAHTYEKTPGKRKSVCTVH